jgi:Tfp pilus assembly protein PilF
MNTHACKALLITHMSRQISFLLFAVFFSLGGICVPSHASAQADSILAFPEAEHHMRLDSLLLKIGFTYTESASRRLEKMEKEFEDEGFEDLALMCLLHRIIIHPAGTEADRQAREQLLLRSIDEAHRNGYTQGEGKLLLYGGFHATQYGWWGIGFERMMKGYDLLTQYGWADPYQKVSDLEVMSNAYYGFSDFESSIRFFKEAGAVKLPAPSRDYPRNLLNNIGLCYLKMEQYDSAVHYLSLAVEAAKVANDTFWIALTTGNLGHAYYKMGRYDEAWPLIETDYTVSIRMNQPGSAANAAQSLATMALHKGALHEAEEYMRYADKNKSTYEPESLINYYANLYTYTRLKGNFALAVQYADSLDLYTKRLEAERDKKILEQAKLRVQVDKYNTNIQLLEKDRKRQVLLRNLLFVILVLSALLTVTWIRRLQFQRRKEAELNLIREKNAADLLLHAQNELSTYTQALVEKNELIQSFRTEIEALQHSGSMQHDERMSRMVDLTNSSILTDDDWKRFRELFDQVYPGFFIRLKEKMPDLTPGEIRLLALTKLQITPRDMAGMLGISADSIKKTRHRLRRKINLPEDGTLDEVVAMI